jgi:predicted DNA-binding protein YlxM (UPF0122 family)
VINNMVNKNKNRKRKALALTLGLGLAVGSLTMGTSAIVHANQQRPAESQNVHMDQGMSADDKANHQELLTLLKIDEQTFKQEQSSGKSLAEIAAAHKVSRQAVVDLLVKDMNQQIDKGLAEQSITVAIGKEMKANNIKEAQKMVDGQTAKDGQSAKEEQSAKDGLTTKDEQSAKDGLTTKDEQSAKDRPSVKDGQSAKDNRQSAKDGQSARNQQAQDRQIPQELLTLLKIDEQTFNKEQSSGKSLAEIGKTHDVSRQALVDFVVKDMKQQIDKGLAEKRITMEQASEMKTNAVEEAQKIVDKKMVVQPANTQK